MGSREGRPLIRCGIRRATFPPQGGRLFGRLPAAPEAWEDQLKKTLDFIAFVRYSLTQESFWECDRYDRQTGYADRVLRRDGGHRPVLPPPRHGCERICAGRALCGPLAHRFRLRHFLFLRRGLRGLRRTVWMEVRHCGHLGGNRQRPAGLAAGLGGAGPPDPHHDPAPQLRHHAGVLRQALRQRQAEDRRLSHHLHLPHPLHRLAVQRTVPPVRHGL